jgi:hypothetical protein
MLTNAVHRFRFACAFALMIGSAACGGSEVGRICDLGSNPGVSESVVASPSLDCVSRTCLEVALEVAENNLPPGSSYPKNGLGLCTDRCEQDQDCERVPESPCQTGFTCAVPVSVGPFCCEKFCICKDYIVIPDGGRQAPMACAADNDKNTCCNLPGRAGNPAYPNCP